MFRRRAGRGIPRLAGAVGPNLTIELGRNGIWMFWRAVTPELARGLEEAADSFHRIEKSHPGRFLLGVGIGHPEHTAEYRSPYDSIVDYLDRLAAAGVPVESRALAALGPKVLKLAAERTAGAHPYLTTPEHTREARQLIGPDALLAPEQKVVLNTDPEAARAIGRPIVKTPYLGLVNYRSNWLRTGWTEADLDGGGSDALVDALVAHGTAAEAAAALNAHLDAGANHVCAQILTAQGTDPLPAFRELAAVGISAEERVAG